MRQARTYFYRLRMTILLLMAVGTTAFAQETLIIGQVLNASDGFPIPNVSVYFKNTNIGMLTNEEGYYLLRNSGNETTVVFSLVGYKTKELKIKPGQTLGMDVRLDESNRLLDEILVYPGINPALLLMKKIRLLRNANDVTKHTGYSATEKEQSAVVYEKNARMKKAENTLNSSFVLHLDTSRFYPLLLNQREYSIGNKIRQQIADTTYNTPPQFKNVMMQLLGGIDFRVNFYDNTVRIFDKSLISPLSNIGGSFYNYYLTDSVSGSNGKLYEIKFHSKNKKDLAFDGRMLIDSATLALVEINAKLPVQANLNYVKKLQISGKFIRINSAKEWYPATAQLSMDLDFRFAPDSLQVSPEIQIRQNRFFTYNSSISKTQTDTALYKGNTIEELDKKMAAIDNMPGIRTAKWLADVIFTGNIPVGIFDIGKIEEVMRVSDLEGFRLTLPLHTNERLWKNASIGGHIGYGFKNEALKYSAFAQFKIPSGNRKLIGIRYTDDYRRVDYEYNNFIYRENPLRTGDEDITRNIFAFRSNNNLNERKELELSLNTDLNNNVESGLFLRKNIFYPATMSPFFSNGKSFASLQQYSATLSARFSFGQRKYNDHLQRLYVGNHLPVIYAIAEGGRYKITGKQGNYLKLSGTINQLLAFDLGTWNYLIEAGCVIGSVPYPLLEMPAGSETNGYSFYRFNAMKRMEYAADKYINIHNEWNFNGLLLNHVPLINRFNLREIASFKLAYGSCSNKHSQIIDFPASTSGMNKPYMEVGIGISNIFHILSVQSVWRLTSSQLPDPDRWSIRSRISFVF